MTDLEMAAAFRAAADYFRQNGWCQFDPGEDGGPRCATGGLRSVSDRAWELSAVAGKRVPAEINPMLFMEKDRRFLLHAVGDCLSEGHLVQWNDAPGRTKEDVIALFEDLAADLELRHQIKSQPVEAPKQEVLV